MHLKIVSFCLGPAKKKKKTKKYKRKKKKTAENVSVCPCCFVLSFLLIFISGLLLFLFLFVFFFCSSFMLLLSHLSDNTNDVDAGKIIQINFIVVKLYTHTRPLLTHTVADV